MAVSTWPVDIRRTCLDPTNNEGKVPAFSTDIVENLLVTMQILRAGLQPKFAATRVSGAFFWSSKVVHFGRQSAPRASGSV